MHDLIIIGAGPAGITASVYAARKRMNFIVISEDIGGQTALSGDIENYTGYQFITGTDLTSKFQEHIKKYNVQLKEGEKVLDIKSEQDVITIKTDKETYQAKTAIIATGKRSRELNVPGEKEFKNKGLSYCATCDGPLFLGKDVAIIGGGNSGLEAAIQLIKIAKKVYIIDTAPTLTADEILIEKLRQDKKVSVINEAQITTVLGDKLVSGIRIKRAGKEETLLVQGVFAEIGLIPNSEFAKTMTKNEKGEIIVDSHNRTNVPAIFAAGDVTDVPEKQIIVAAGEGSKAVLSAFRYISRQK